MTNNQNMRLRYETLQKKIDDICTMDKKAVTRFYFLVVWLVTRVPSGFLAPHLFGIVSGSCVLFPCRLSTRAFPLINSLSFAPIFVLWPSLVSWLWEVISVSFLCQCTLNTLSSVICFAQRLRNMFPRLWWQFGLPPCSRPTLWYKLVPVELNDLTLWVPGVMISLPGNELYKTDQ